MEYRLREALLPIKDSYSTIEKVFAARGIEPNDIQHYLHTSEADLIDPCRLGNMDNGVKLLLEHIKIGSQILVLVDCDADGYTSAAALINYLNMLFPYYAQNKISYRIHDGKQHGLEDQVEYIMRHNEYKLIICPDSSSNDYEQHKLLRENGYDILVLDHHEADRYSPDAIVINNQLSNDYPTKSLSGVGVVYKFCSRIDKVLGKHYAEDILDLVAIGMIGDMMDIRDYETKYLINAGLNNIRNPFVSQMVQQQAFSINKAGGLCPFSVSFYIVPQINGTIRMGTIEEKLLLFESMLDFKGIASIPSTKRGCKGQFETVAEQACRNATNIKRHQDAAVTQSIALVEKIIQDKKLDENKIIAVKLLPGQLTSRNLTGLIANKLMAKYKHPFLLLTQVTHEDGSITWDGSGRGYNTATFNDFKSFVKESGYSLLSEGHASAFGCSIADEQFENFINYSNSTLKEVSFEPCARVDFIWDKNAFTERDVKDIAELKMVWGQNVEEPMVAIENVAITKDNLAVYGKDNKHTIRITLPNGVPMIKFGVTKDEIDRLRNVPEHGCVFANFLGKCSLNEWNGEVSGQIMVDDYELTGQTGYYF